MDKNAELDFLNLQLRISFSILNKTKLTNHIKEVILIKICQFYAGNDEIILDNDILNLLEIKDIIQHKTLCLNLFLGVPFNRQN